MSSMESSLKTPRWVGPVVFLLATGIVFLLVLLGMSIVERRWEAQRPALALIPLDEWETDNARWGRNYPRQYDSWKQTALDNTRTLYGGAAPRDYLDENPRLVILFAGMPFSKDYLQAGGHFHSVRNVVATRRVNDSTVATCWTCKSADVPRMIARFGSPDSFYRQNFRALQAEMTNAIGCIDCHDPRTLRLRISRPGLAEGLAALGRRSEEATHQEMRALACAQCHSEYYFRGGYDLTFPWRKGLTVENMIAYYDEVDFADWKHPISGAAMLKSQHPDYELWSTGIHAFRGVTCADCHMPYQSEGGVKFTDHRVQSPLVNVANSCGVCHRWSEAEVRTRVESIQTKVYESRNRAEEVLVKAHFDVRAAQDAGASVAELAAARRLLRHAQFRWDYIASSKGMGFHSPQESMRILGDAAREAQEARLLATRLLAVRGVTAPPRYPAFPTRAQAAAVAAAYVEGRPPTLLN